MKKSSLTISAICALCFVATAQTPQTIPYQAVARDASGNLLVNANICVQFRIYNQAAGGTLLYEEHQTVTTNKLGLFNLNMGAGTYDGGTSSNLSGINWASTSEYVEIGLDLTGACSSYTTLARSQMLSVPYALYAGSAASAGGTAGGDLTGNYPAPKVTGLQGNAVSAAAPANQDVLQWNGSAWVPSLVVGPAGATGATGPQGAQGNAGATGATGATGLLAAGATGSVPYYNGSAWVPTSTNLYNNGINVGINNAATAALFSIGSASPLTVDNSGDLATSGTLGVSGLSTLGSLSQSGSANINNNSSSNTTNIGTGSTTGTVTIGGAAAQSINLGSGAGAGIAQIVNLGSTTGASATNINSGTGAVNINSGSTGSVNISTGISAGAVSIGQSNAVVVSNTGTITIAGFAGDNDRSVYADANGLLHAATAGTVNGSNSTAAIISATACTVNSSQITLSGLPTSISGSQVSVTVSTTATMVSQLRIFLTNPAGTILNLINTSSQTGAAITNTVFSDNGSSAFPTGGTAPYSATFKPDGGTAATCSTTPTSGVTSFGTLGTINPNGVWTLTVLNPTGGTAGTFTWSIKVTPNSSYHLYTYTGSNITTPAFAAGTYLVKLWGAGGGYATGPGGGGGFITGILSLATSTALTIIVGEGGINGQTANAGAMYGGGGQGSSDGDGGYGGGRSAIQISGADVVTAGGGGGGAYDGASVQNLSGGGGGGYCGLPGLAYGNGTSIGWGGTQTAAGLNQGYTAASGSGNNGGSAYSSGGNAGGGGGGWFGGAGGGNSSLNGGGGGGSSGGNPVYFTITGSLYGGTIMPGGTNDPDYMPPVGVGGGVGFVSGGNGLVIISSYP